MKGQIEPEPTFATFEQTLAELKFAPDGKVNDKANLTACYQCHLPFAKDDYLTNLAKLAEKLFARQMESLAELGYRVETCPDGAAAVEEVSATSEELSGGAATPLPALSWRRRAKGWTRCAGNARRPPAPRSRCPSSPW